MKRYFIRLLLRTSYSLEYKIFHFKLHLKNLYYYMHTSSLTYDIYMFCISMIHYLKVYLLFFYSYWRGEVDSVTYGIAVELWILYLQPWKLHSEGKKIESLIKIFQYRAISFPFSWGRANTKYLRQNIVLYSLAHTLF